MNPSLPNAANPQISRRALLNAGLGLLAAPAFIPANALGRNAAPPPSQRLNVAVIGLGARGTVHVNTLIRMPQAQVLAVCDPFQSKALAAKNTIDTWYTAAAGSTYRACDAYQDFRQLLARDDIDAVFVSSPEHWHAIHMAQAIKAGKDVYGEKSLTHTIPEGRALINTVRDHAAVFQAGTQQRSDSKFRHAAELALNGYLGDLKHIHVAVPGSGRIKPGIWPVADPPPDLDYDLWLGPAMHKPYREDLCTHQWYYVSDYCLGWIVSWGVHHLDTAMWGCPTLYQGKMLVEGSAEFFNATADVSHTWHVTFTPESGPALTFTDDAHAPGHGCRFVGADAWTHVTRQNITASDPSLLRIRLKPSDIHLQPSTHHHQDFFDAVRTRRDPVAPIESCHRATALAIVADIATRLRRKLVWDWQTELFLDDEPANRMLHRAFRSPWTL